jgi:hypothetical protein
MKIFCVVTVARQVEGDQIGILVEKAFRRASAAEKYIQSLPKTYAETRPGSYGSVNFMCERGIHEIELEEEQTKE